MIEIEIDPRDPNSRIEIEIEIEIDPPALLRMAACSRVSRGVLALRATLAALAP
jgi:hypothetical protein